MNESVIDPPKLDLCPDVWHRVMDETGSYETYHMLPDIRKKLIAIVKYICECSKIKYSNVFFNITGSITSNTYTENADIDLHIHLKDKTGISADNLNTKFRTVFKYLISQAPQYAKIGMHPIEIYYQENEFQDLMSVGCYNVLQNQWLIGPEFKDSSYDPYSELYAEIKKLSKNLVRDIRNIILDTYEKAVVMVKSSQFETAKNTMEGSWSDLSSSLKHAAVLYSAARAMRKSYSSPQSAEEALQYRNSKKWKIADAAFKLMDKFGYLAILKEFSEIVENSLDSALCVEIANSVLSCVKHYINNADKLAEKDKANESLKVIAAKAKIIIEKLTRTYLKNISKKVALAESKHEDLNDKYVREFKDFFGYKDDYLPSNTYSEQMDSLAAECALRMPTDTAAREIEGDTVMLLVLSGEEDAVKAGKKLGDCMMKKGKHDEETLLKRMSDAYKALQDLWSKYEYENKIQQEAIKSIFNKSKCLTESWKPKYDNLPINQWGERWISLPRNHYIVGHIEDIAKDCQLDPDNNDPKVDRLGISSVHTFSDGRLLVTVFGGANGGQMPGENNFKLYLAIVKKFIGKLLDGYGENRMFEDAWLVDWDNDCCDDVWTLRFCLTLTKHQLVHFKDCTELPVDADDDGKAVFNADEILSVAKADDINCNSAKVCKDGCIVIDGEFPDEFPCNSLVFYWYKGDKDTGPRWCQGVKCRNKWNKKLIDVLNLLYPFGLTTYNINNENTQKVNEDMKKTLSIATVVALMAIPGLLPKSALAAELKNTPIATMTVNSPEIKKAVSNAAVKKYNRMNVANIANAVARTIYAEGKGEGEKGQAAIASVIWNRAGGKAENLIPVISKRKQFSCWNDYTGGWTDKDYKYVIPSETFKNSKNKAIWDNCMLLAAKLITEEFTSTIGNRNSYMNKKTADKSNVDSWGQKLDLKIGNHDFGYLSYNDGFKTKKTTSNKTYTIKHGDTLSKIAKKFNTTASELAKKNNIKDANKIAIGQKIKV